jgi:probable rRNA maturation factor
MAVSIYFQDIKRPYFVSNQRISSWLDALARQYGRSVGELNIVFMSDDELLKINQQFLQHDYYTDIITFDNGTTDKMILGELYISLDRVRDNAKTMSEKYQAELLRVVAHGVLHLIGYQDKKSEQIVEMRACESDAISLYLSMNSSLKEKKS